MDTDGVHPLMLKHCGHQFQMILFFLFNTAFSSGKWPWRKGNVKTGEGSYNGEGSHRPITITSFEGKSFENVLKSRIQNFIDNNELLSSDQHGFRAGYSPGSYMLELISVIVCDGIFVDLQKAFDSVWLSNLESCKLKENRN